MRLADGSAESAFTGGGFTFAEDGTQQRGLAGAVGADDGHHVAAHGGGVESLHQRAAADGDIHLVAIDHAVAAAFLDLERERHRLGLAGRRSEARQAREQLAASLRLLGVLPRDVAADELLFLGDELALLVHLPFERQPALGALRHEGRVAAAVGRDGAGLDVEHVVHGFIEEGAVVADDERRAAAFEQVLLQPLGGFEIQVVGWFVEEQHVGGGHELRGQANAPAFAAGKHGDALDLGLLRVEAQALQHRVHPRMEVVASFVGESLHVVAVAVERGGIWVRAHLGQAIRLFGQRCLELNERGKRLCGGFPYGFGVAEVAMLVEQRQPQAAGARHGTGRGALVAGDETEQRRLAGAIAADDAPTLALRDGEGDIAEERCGAEVDAHAGKSDLGHANNLIREPL